MELLELLKKGEVMISVKLKHNEPIERALRRFKRILDKEGVLNDLRERKHYLKPSEKKRKKSARARARVRKENSPDNRRDSY